MFSCKSWLDYIDYTKETVHLLSQVFVLSFPDWLLCDNGCVDVGFKIGYELLHLESVFHYFTFSLVYFDSYLLHGIGHFLKVLNQVVIFAFEILIGLVDYVHEYFTVVL